MSRDGLKEFRAIYGKMMRQLRVSIVTID